MANSASRPPDPLAPLRGKLPRGWECWTGVAGLLYARYPKSSPPIVLRATSADELARLVREQEARWRA
jgi:hypothetical protein